MIEEGKECEAYGVEEIATDNDIEAKEAKDDSMEDGNTEDSFPLILETSAVASESHVRLKRRKVAERKQRLKPMHVTEK